MAFFGQILLKWEPFWVPRFLKICFQQCFYYYVCRKSFWRNNYLFHGIDSKKLIYFMALILKNGHFWEIFGHFELFWAISKYPELLNFCPIHYFLSSDFQSAAFRHKHCFPWVFQKFLLQNS